MSSPIGPGPNDALVYDALTMSTAPQGALALAGLLAAAALASWLWHRLRQQPGRVLTGWFIAASAVFTLVAAGLVWEQQTVADPARWQTVQGPVQGLWEDRVRRAGNDRGYWNWQGFSVDGVAFAYVRNSDGNFFNNAGPYQIELRDGQPLRVHYVERNELGERARHIVRIERVTTVE